LITIYVDGSPTKIAYTIDDGKFVEDIEFSTNFEAEYKAIIGALHKLSTFEAEGHAIILFCDSAVVVAQLLGKAQVKAVNLLPLYRTVIMLVESLDKITAHVNFGWVKRNENKAGWLLE